MQMLPRAGCLRRGLASYRKQQEESAVEMGKGEDFELLKIQTHTLKVNIHCDGCKLKVKKLLHRTEGVFSVSIDVEEQKVTVSGNVDCETLIRKLIKAGKHTELWTQKINQTRQLNQQHMKDANKNNNEQDKQGLMRGLKAFKSQHNKLSPSSSDEEDFDDDDDDDDDDDEDVDFDEEEEEDDGDDMQNLDSKMKQTNFMRQANNAPSNTKQNGNGNGKAGANAKIGCNGKGGENANQNHIKSPNEPQRKGTNAAANNRVASGNPKVQGNNGVMGLGPPGLVGGNNGCLPGKAFKGYTGHPPQCGGQYQSPATVNRQGYQTHPSSSMVNNLRGHNKVVVHESRYMQPQMTHLRTPQISPYAGYYNCYPSPHHLNNQVDNGYYGTHFFSDENTNACIIM